MVLNVALSTKVKYLLTLQSR